MEQSKLEAFMKTANDEVLAEIAELTGMTATTFISGDPYRSAYQEGIRSIGLKLISMTERPALDINKIAYKKRFGHLRKDI